MRALRPSTSDNAGGIDCNIWRGGGDGEGLELGNFLVDRAKILTDEIEFTKFNNPISAALVFFPVVLIFMIAILSVLGSQKTLLIALKRSLLLSSVILLAASVLFVYVLVFFGWWVSLWSYCVAMAVSYPEVVFVLIANRCGIPLLSRRTHQTINSTEPQKSESHNPQGFGLLFLQFSLVAAATFWRYLLIFGS